MNFDSRVALVGVAVLVVALAFAAAPAAADDDDDDIGIATGDGLNSTLDLSASGDLGGQSGSGSLDCEGQPTHHECDKGGGADTSVGSVDYTGDNYGNDSSQRYGGGDEVTVASGGEQATFEFDCASRTAPGGDDCTINVTSSQGDAPGPLGESDGDDESEDGDDSDDSEDVPGSAYAEVGVAEGEGPNSTLAFGYEGESENGSSEGAVDCVGQPTHHSCDKGGELTLGPLSVDYVGDNYADDDDRRFGGGDEFAVRGMGEALLVGFDCDFDTSPSEETCDFDAGSSQGDAPGQFGPEEGEFEDEPGDERADEGEENGNDDGNRNGNAG